MPSTSSRTSTAGRNMAGARAPVRRHRHEGRRFGKAGIIAIANSFTQFVPGHVHLKDLGRLVAREIETAGGVAEFNTIAVDDGIAMGHGGMLYSLPLASSIADAVEYMVTPTADALGASRTATRSPRHADGGDAPGTSRRSSSGGPMEAAQEVKWVRGDRSRPGGCDGQAADKNRVRTRMKTPGRAFGPARPAVVLGHVHGPTR